MLDIPTAATVIPITGAVVLGNGLFGMLRLYRKGLRDISFYRASLWYVAFSKVERLQIRARKLREAEELLYKIGKEAFAAEVSRYRWDIEKEIAFEKQGGRDVMLQKADALLAEAAPPDLLGRLYRKNAGTRGGD